MAYTELKYFAIQDSTPEFIVDTLDVAFDQINVNLDILETYVDESGWKLGPRFLEHLDGTQKVRMRLGNLRSSTIAVASQQDYSPNDESQFFSGKVVWNGDGEINDQSAAFLVCAARQFSDPSATIANRACAVTRVAAMVLHEVTHVVTLKWRWWNESRPRSIQGFFQFHMDERLGLSTGGTLCQQTDWPCGVGWGPGKPCNWREVQRNVSTLFNLNVCQMESPASGQTYENQ